MENGHPTHDELRRLMQHFLPLGESQTVIDHLRECRPCNEVYRSMSDGQAGVPLAPELQAAAADIRS
jgi:hypothetical protein